MHDHYDANLDKRWPCEVTNCLLPGVFAMPAGLRAVAATAVPLTSATLDSLRWRALERQQGGYLDTPVLTEHVLALCDRLLGLERERDTWQQELAMVIARLEARVADLTRTDTKVPHDGDGPLDAVP